jgi:hypothetical protein
MASKSAEERKQERQQEQTGQINTQPTRLQRFGRTGQWFQMLCLMHIPIFGFLYMLVLALRRKTPPQKKSFAAAYILYRILVLLLAGTIVFVLYRVGLSFVDEILKYAGVAS